jgi:methyl-accepting chemotaxis protein
MNLADRDYFQKGLKGETSISNVITSKATGNRIVVVAAPVKGDDGKILGVMSASINFENLINQFLGESLDQTIIPNLVDNQNILQVHPTKEWIGKGIEETEISAEVKDVINKGKSMSGYALVKDQGKEYVAAYTPIEISGYVLYLKTPMDTVLSATDGIKKATLLLVLISTVLIVLVAWFTSQKMSLPVKRLTEHVKEIANGNLTLDTLEVTAKDEIGQLTESINTMSTSLKDLIKEVNISSEQVAAHAEELSAGAEESKITTEHITSSIQQVSSGAETQSDRVAESFTAIEEVAIGISKIADSSSSISDVSSATIQKAEIGGESVQKTVAQMKSIQSSVHTSHTTIKSLDERSKQIGSIVEVITGIAEQTNLLALNAAIEAARAGEQGKGFAVVAAEVRKLAEESKKSSDQIRKLIVEIQQDMVKSLQGMDKVTNDVDDGIILADATESNFKEIIESTQLVAEQIDDMAATAQQISAATSQVAVSFASIADITKETTASTQEVASASEEQLGSMEEITSSSQSLSQMALDLRDMIKKFKI